MTFRVSQNPRRIGEKGRVHRTAFYIIVLVCALVVGALQGCGQVNTADSKGKSATIHGPAAEPRPGEERVFEIAPGVRMTFCWIPATTSAAWKGISGTCRLPTEAEWEYACRAGTQTVFHDGDSLDATMANFDGNYPYGSGRKGEYRDETVAVGSFKPNAWGLHDMHGNVWEWCADWYGEYPAGLAVDPSGPPSGEDRVLRGGSWGNLARYCRSAYRDGYDPGDRGGFLGFRLARDAP